MPIPFTCPQCGSYTLVSDEYSGKTGPCSSCSQPVTVPLIHAPKRSGLSIWIVAPLVACVAAAVLTVVAVVVILTKTRSTFATPVPAAVAYNQNVMQSISVALHNYHSEHGTLPPAYIANEDGSRRTSWRALLLPQINPSMAAAYKYGENWDSYANRHIRNMTIAGFTAISPGQQLGTEANFLLITGAGTAFEGDKATPFGQFLNGTSNVVIAVQVSSMGIEWSEPRDIDIDELPLLLKSGQVTDENGLVRFVYADGRIGQMSIPAAINQLPKMALTGAKPSMPAGPAPPAVMRQREDKSTGGKPIDSKAPPADHSP